MIAILLNKLSRVYFIKWMHKICWFQRRTSKLKVVSRNLLHLEKINNHLFLTYLRSKSPHPKNKKIFFHKKFNQLFKICFTSERSRHVDHAQSKCVLMVVLGALWFYRRESCSFAFVLHESVAVSSFHATDTIKE